MYVFTWITFRRQESEHFQNLPKYFIFYSYFLPKLKYQNIKYRYQYLLNLFAWQLSLSRTTLAFVISSQVRWGLGRRGNTCLLQPRVLPLLWVARLLRKSNCGLHRLPCEGSEEAIVEKVHFSSPCHWNRKFIHLGILKKFISSHTSRI